MTTTSAQHENWSSRLTFLFATVGAAIGLGNLWRFPYVAGENGGGAFVLVYMFSVFAIGVPLMMAELSMGRRGQKSPVTTMRNLRAEQGSHGIWQAIGWLSVLSPVIAMCFYAVVAGWSLDYVYRAILGGFANLSSDQSSAAFASLLASPGRMTIWYTLYIAATVFVVSRGIRHGIEEVTKFMMPALFLMIVLLVIYAHVIGDVARAYRFLFYPDFSRLTWSGALMALGQAFFSVTVGTGALITYGSYLGRDVNIANSSWVIAIADTIAAIMAGLAIFPVVFASGLDPAEGPGLMFVTLPVALGQMPGGYFFSIVFFILVFFAAFTSSLAMLEPFVSWAEENRSVSRAKVTCWTGFVIWVVGLSAVLSFNFLKDFTPLDIIPLYEGRNIFSILDFTVSNVLLPINALLIALFAGWVFKRSSIEQELRFRSAGAYRLWYFFTRYLAPVAVGAVIVVSFAG